MALAEPRPHNTVSITIMTTNKGYYILYNCSIVIFCTIISSIVFVIMITGFAFSFHLLLSKREEFRYPHDAMMKTFLMMSGNIL